MPATDRPTARDVLDNPEAIRVPLIAPVIAFGPLDCQTGIRPQTPMPDRVMAAAEYLGFHQVDGADASFQQLPALDRIQGRSHVVSASFE